MLLERDKWQDVYAVFEAPVNPKTGAPYKSGVAYDKALEEFEAQGLIGVPEEAFDVLLDVENSLKDSGLAAYLQSPFKEVLVVAELDGVLAKGRIDVYS